MPNHPYGRISRAEFERRSALARRLWQPEKAEEHIAVLRLLTDDPATDVRASVPALDADDAEFASLWPPCTQAEAQQREADRQRIAAAAASEMDDDELFAALWPEGEQ
jgi:hypothetical protein